ncbi:MAG: hypothetical protein AAGI66_06240 [Cyanobacteria bacterium P01_H01_bin.74]
MSPKGQLLYASVLVPKETAFDHGTRSMKKVTKKSEMKYELDLIVSADDPETQKLLTEIQALQEVAKAQAKEKILEKYPKKKKFVQQDFDEVGGEKQLPYKVLKDQAGEPTDDIKFSFRKKAFYKDSKTGKLIPLAVDVFDGTGVKITNPKLKIGNGSI